jgi:hypothetical protein
VPSGKTTATETGISVLSSGGSTSSVSRATQQRLVVSQTQRRAAQAWEGAVDILEQRLQQRVNQVTDLDIHHLLQRRRPEAQPTRLCGAEGDVHAVAPRLGIGQGWPDLNVFEVADAGQLVADNALFEGQLLSRR